MKLPGDGPQPSLSVNQRGLFSSQSPLDYGDDAVTFDVRGNKIAVTSAQVTRNDSVLTTIPAGTTDIDVDIYRGSVTVSADGKPLATFK